MTNDIESLLLESTERVLRVHCGANMWREVDAGGWPQTLWNALDEVGLPLALVAEASGGAGLSFAHVADVVKLTAAYALPLPLAETMLAGWLLDQAGIEIPGGPLGIAPTRRDDRLQLRRNDGTWVVSGTLHRVPWGRDCSALVAIATGEDSNSIVLLDKAQLSIETGSNIAGEPRDTLQCANAPVLAMGDAQLTAQQLHCLGAIVRSLQIAGACRTCLKETIEYANLRKQFGRQIGKFQVIQNYIAMLATETAAATAAADVGVDALVRSVDVFGAACAKTRTSEAAGKVTALAHQVFGAIGFTHEHSLHRSTMRLLSWRDEFGSETSWAAELGQRIFAKGGARAWRQIAG